MAILSNINGKFAVEDNGAIKFNNLTGTNNQVLIANTNSSPTWVDVSTIIGGPYLPLTGGTLAGAGNLVIGGTLTVNGVTTLNASTTIIRDSSGYALRLDSANATTDNDLRFAKGGVDYAAIQVSGATNSNFQFYVNDGTNWINTLNFARADGQAVFTKLVSGITPTAAANFTTKAYVDAHPGSGGTVTSVATGNGLSGGTITNTGTLTMSGTYSGNFNFSTNNVVVGGNFTNNPYNSTSGARLMFGSGDSNSIANYYIGTNLENFGGNYTKLSLAWHTGIKIGAQSQYGGVRFYDDEDFSNVILNIGVSNTNVGVVNDLTVGSNLTFTGQNLRSSVGLFLQVDSGNVNAITIDNVGSTTFSGFTYFPDYLFHAGDTNTRIFFETGKITLRGDTSIFLDGPVTANETIKTSGESIGTTQADGDYLAKLYTASADGFMSLYTGQATPLEKVRISSYGDSFFVPANNGKIGIGTTSPQAQLHINEDASNSYATLRLEGANRGGIIDMYNQTSYPVSRILTDQSGNIFISTSGAFASTSLSEKFTILTGGNVGIGTTSPTQKLNVVNDNTATWTAKFTNNTNNVYLSVNDANNYGIYVSGESKNYFSGNIGIGTTTPTALLDFGTSVQDNKIHLFASGNDKYGMGIRSSQLLLYSGALGAGSGGITFGKMNGTTYTESMRITNDGNVGIGVTSPTTAKLIVAGKVMLNNASSPNNLAELNIGSTGSVETRAIDIDGSWAQNENKSISFTYSTGATNLVGQINCKHDSPGSRIRWGKLYHSGDSSTYTMELISSSQTTANLTVAGNITAAADVVAYSDERLKSNIKTLDGSKVLKMRGVSFEKEGKKGSGVIAQELEKVAPELVNNDNEYKGVAYGNLTGYLIEAIKELEARVKELENK